MHRAAAIERLWGRQRTSGAREHLPLCVVNCVLVRGKGKLKRKRRELCVGARQRQAKKEKKKKHVLSMLSITTKWENESHGAVLE